MSKEKQIEEMIEIVKPFVSGLACEQESGSCELTDCRSCNARYLANKLQEAGYCKQSEKYLVKENGDIEPLKKQSGWISVEEKLPEESDCYLVYIISDFGIGCVTFTHYTKRYGWGIPDVTHWMPLPEAPKGGEG